jgi:hypothetical protein
VRVTLEEFMDTTRSTDPPAGLSPALLALWHDARGDWHQAHRITQDLDDRDGAWVHAYLHRREGDSGNAAYWYRRAQRPIAQGPIEEEWERITTALLGLREA